MVLQSNESDCGKCVVRNLLYYFSHSNSHYETKVKRKCNDFLEIREELEEHGLFFESVQIDDFHSLEKMMFPMICQMIQGDCLHFVLVLKASKKKVYVFDPQFGKLTMPISEFLYYFTSKAMIFVRREKHIEKADIKSLLKNYEKAIYIIFGVLLSTTISIFTFYANRTDGFLPGVILTSISLSAIILQNSFNFKVKSRLEKDLLLKQLEISGNKENYEPLYRLINLTIKTYSDSVSYVSLCVGLIFLLLLNSYYFSFLILIGLLFYFLRLPLAEEKNSVNRYCSIKEKVFLNRIEQNEFPESRLVFEEMKKKNERLYLTIIITWALEAMAVSLFSLAIMNIAKIYSLNSFVFCFVLSMSFSYSLPHALSFLDYPALKAKEINALL